MKIKLGFKVDKPDNRDLKFGAVMGDTPADMPTWENGYNVEDSIGEVRNDHQGRTLGCFPGKTRVLMEDMSYRKIVDIRVGDVVFTHLGNKKRVITKMKRKWQGNTYKIKCWGLYQETEATSEHPFFTQDGWKKAEELTTKDYIAIPTLLNYEEDKTIYSFEKDSEFLWVLGLYLAEGYVSKHNVWFSLHSKETDFADRVKKTMAKYGADVNFYTRDKRPNSLTVSISGQKWAKIFKELGSEYCDRKRINKRLLSLDPKLQLEIYNGWKDGDGHQDGNRNIGVTTSHKLVWQMHHIILRNNIKGNIQKRKDIDGKKRVYVLEVNENPNPNKERNNKGQLTNGNPRSYFEGNYRFAQVKDIEKVSAYMGENVYNFEVEDDNSYIVNSLGVHNCVTFGSTSDIETAYRSMTGKEVHLSQRWLYSRIHLANGASSPRDAYKLMHKEGVCEDEYMPTNPSKNLTESQLRATHKLPGAVENAKKYKIGAYYSVSPYNWTEFIQAIFQNKGVGFGYIPVEGRMGHFVFAIGYKLLNGYQALVYHDSYSPYVKHILKKGNYFYKETGQRIQMYSAWTAAFNPDWAKDMETALVKKKNQKEVFLLINGKRYWITDEKSLEDIVLGGCLGSKTVDEAWKSIKEVDVLPGLFEGDIIGKKNLAQILKNIFGTVQ